MELSRLFTRFSGAEGIFLEVLSGVWPIMEGEAPAVLGAVGDGANHLVVEDPGASCGGLPASQLCAVNVDTPDDLLSGQDLGVNKGEQLVQGGQVDCHSIGGGGGLHHLLELLVHLLSLLDYIVVGAGQAGQEVCPPFQGLVSHERLVLDLEQFGWCEVKVGLDEFPDLREDPFPWQLVDHIHEVLLAELGSLRLMLKEEEEKDHELCFSTAQLNHAAEVGTDELCLPPEV